MRQLKMNGYTHMEVAVTGNVSAVTYAIVIPLTYLKLRH